MRHPYRMAALFTLVAPLAACSAASRPITDADVAAIHVQIDKYVHAALAADWDGWGSTLTPDAVALPPNSPPLVGRAAAVAYVRAFPRLTSFTVATDEITGRGDIAFARGTYSLTATMPDGSSMNERGSFLEIHQRQADGTWPYSRLIWHSNAPLPAPTPAR
jgi:ketosteroid isomerase-like protein